MGYDDIKKAAVDEMNRALSERRGDGVLSKAHDEGHCIAVGKYGGVTTAALMSAQGYETEPPRSLAEISGYLHDTTREKTETEPHGNSGAIYFISLHKNQEPFTELNPREAAIVHDVIYHHEGSFGDIKETFGDVFGHEYQILPSAVAHAIVTGDRCFEASGFRVFADRRPFFVGNERTKKGDLKDIFKWPDESHLSVLGETMIRLYKRNPIDQYPNWLRALGEDMHAVQYLGYRGLLHYMNMNEEEAADFFIEKGFPKFTPEVAEQIKKERHLDGGFFDSEKYPVLSAKISEIGEYDSKELDHLAEGTVQMIKEVASAEKPEDAFDNYMSLDDTTHLNRYFQYFMGGASDYRKGSEENLKIFEDALREQIERNRSA